MKAALPYSFESTKVKKCANELKIKKYGNKLEIKKKYGNKLKMEFKDYKQGL